MLVTFRTKAYAHSTMFGDIAVELLKLGGLTGNVPTAILAAEIPGFLGRLERALTERQAAQAQATGGAGSGGDERDARSEEDAEPPVPLRNRALPLIQLLRAAQTAEADVIVSASG
jgi:hypothetical protein